MFDFIAYLRWRSLIVYMIIGERLATLVLNLSVKQQIINLIVVFITSIIHQWFIYKKDRGITHSQITEKLENIENSQIILTKLATQNQGGIIEILNKVI
jgi:hypothetical protein